MSDISLHGLAFFVVSLGTVALGATGLVVQSLVVAVLAIARPADRPSWGRGVAIAAAGPVIAVVLGGLAALAGATRTFGPDALETLDALAWAVPAIAIVLWIAVEIAVVRSQRR